MIIYTGEGVRDTIKRLEKVLNNVSNSITVIKQSEFDEYGKCINVEISKDVNSLTEWKDLEYLGRVNHEDVIRLKDDIKIKRYRPFKTIDEIYKKYKNTKLNQIWVEHSPTKVRYKLNDVMFDGKEYLIKIEYEWYTLDKIFHSFNFYNPDTEELSVFGMMKCKPVEDVKKW